jgi:hypothetical protein
MNRPLADKIAQSALYEGYILYPDRPSARNRQRWTFGGIYPPAWANSQNGSDPDSLRTEVLVAGPTTASVQVVIRFLQLIDCAVGEFVAPNSPEFRLVPSLQIGEKNCHAGQKAAEREIDAGSLVISELEHFPSVLPFYYPAQRTFEPIVSPTGEKAGVLIRTRHETSGLIEVNANTLADGAHQISVTITNLTDFDSELSGDRDQALLRSLNSVHAMFGVEGAEFVSLIDPPSNMSLWAGHCRNRNLWPVLVGASGEHDTMLASPIILYDYPQIAPESPGNLFDRAEIDEILSPRIPCPSESL